MRLHHHEGFKGYKVDRDGNVRLVSRACIKCGERERFPETEQPKDVRRGRSFEPTFSRRGVAFALVCFIVIAVFCTFLPYVCQAIQQRYFPV